MIKLPKSELNAMKPIIAARRRAVNASGIKKMPIMDMASSIKKGTIIRVVRKPHKKDFILFV